MKNRWILGTLCVLLAGIACTPQNALYDDSARPLAVRMAESEMVRAPRAAQLDGVEVGRIKWTYTIGLELLSMMDAARAYDRPDFYDYALDYYDSIVQPDASIITYKKEKYNIDLVCPARPLFEIAERTGEQRYAAAIDTIYSQLLTHPRNPDGGFWHKQVYPHQMWLDGLYMGEPFYAEYVKRHLQGEAYDAAVKDIVNQFVRVAEHTYDPATGLFRHAYDDSREMFWCDKTTGQSAHAWGRAMGWYAMAIVETLQYLGSTTETHPMVEILNRIYDTLPKYADKKSGMWYQVLDCPGRDGNYQEATGSIMFVYAMLKGVRLGYLPEDLREEALENYERFVDRFVRENEDGTISITDCCAVAGLGGKSMRDGSYEYYLSEPVIENDCKGVGPFIWASMEYDMAKGRL